MSGVLVSVFWVQEVVVVSLLGVLLSTKYLYQSSSARK